MKYSSRNNTHRCFLASCSHFTRDICYHSTCAHLTLFSRLRKCNYILHALTRASHVWVHALHTHTHTDTQTHTLQAACSRRKRARAIVHVCVHRVTNVRAWVRVSRARRARVIRVGEAKRVSSVLVLVSWQSLSTTTSARSRPRRRRRRRRRRQRWRRRQRQRRRQRWSLSLSLSRAVPISLTR